MITTTATYLVIDTETTGLDPAEHRPVEVGAVLVKGDQVTVGFTSLLFPGRPVSLQALATHGIRTEDVVDAPKLEDTLPWLNALAAKADAIVAHNAAFDRPMLPGFAPDKPWLCTLRLARHLLPEVETHSNTALRHFLNLSTPEVAGIAHRALADAQVTARLLVKLLEIAAKQEAPADLAELIAWSERPRLLKTVTFGKHKGLEWAQVPTDYLQWMARQQDTDPDVAHTVKHHLTRGRA